MSKDKNKQDEIFLSFSRKYRKAVFGMRYVAFMTENEDYVLPKEAEQSLSATMSFYRNSILKRKNYPILKSDEFTYVDSHDFRVLFDVLGLPEVIFSTIDFNRDILSQLHFEDGLENHSRECYQERAEMDGSKWYHDDFINYCIQSGIFFLYDETIPFIENDNPPLPVFFEKERFSDELQKQIDEFNYEKLAIDFLPFDYDADFVSFMKEMDGFPLCERISYFVNGDYDQNIAAHLTSADFRQRYAKLLRWMIVVFVNRLYDTYSEEILKRPTDKLSYNSIGTLHLERKMECISSFGGDMFSADGKHWSLSSYQRKEIRDKVLRLVTEYGMDDTLAIYTKLALPYPGYIFLRGKKFRSADELVRALPFSDDITLQEYYLSPKRYSLNYSFYSSREEHDLSFYQRVLERNGVVYTPVSHLLDENRNFSVLLYPKRRKGMLAKLFDGKDFSLLAEVYPSYLVSNGESYDRKLEKALSGLDALSENHAGFIFFSLLRDNVVSEALEKLLARYDAMSDLSILLPFFDYLVFLPFNLAKSIFWDEVRKAGEINLLHLLDAAHDATDSYEPSLPYPYVQKGKLFYSFRKTPLSEAYLSLSDKDVLTEMEEHYGSLFDRYYATETLRPMDRITWIVDRLGLPKNIANPILYAVEKNSDSIVSLIPFEKGLSHSENHAEPAFYDALDSHAGAQYNVYGNYLKVKAARHGLYLEPDFSALYLDDRNFYNLLHDGAYHTIIDVDLKRCIPELKPYLNLDKKALCSFFACFYPKELDDYGIISLLFRFLDESDETIHSLLYDCDDKNPLCLDYAMILGKFYSLYQSLKMACIMRETGNDIHTEYSFNYDYNPSLVYPYVLLGTRFNAYTKDIEKGPYFFCECDREPIRKALQWYLFLWNTRKVPEEWKTPLILASLGLPYLVVLEKRNFDFDLSSIDDFIDSLSFRDAICRRCLNIPHCAYHAPFRLSYPFKKGDEAEQRFANEAIIKDGFLNPFFDQRMEYLENDYDYDLDAKFDPRLPYYVFLDESVPESIFRFFNPDRKEIQDGLYEIGKSKFTNQEALAYASGVLLDAYQRESEVFFRFIQNLHRDETLGGMVKKFFPEVNRVRDGFKEPVIKLILEFFAYLNNQMMESYLYLERHIGR